MTTAPASFRLRAYEPADLDAVLRLLERALAGGPTGSRSAEFFRWKHEANPFGRSFALVAEEAGELIGFRTFLRWRFRAGDRVVRAVRPVDTATDPEHQGRGVFSSLTRAALVELPESADVVFNTPNAQSLPGYLKLGWTSVGIVPIALRPVRPVRFARGVRHATRGAPGGPPPACPLPPADDVLAGAAVGHLLEEHDDGRWSTQRSVEYLRWRYVQPPGLDYRAIAVEQGGTLVGLGLGRARQRGPLREFLLAEVLTRPGDTTTARRILRGAARTGCDHVTTHLPAATCLRRAGLATGYLSWPRLGMTLVAKPLVAVEPDPTELSSWRFALGDLEVF